MFLLSRNSKICTLTLVILNVILLLGRVEYHKLAKGQYKKIIVDRWEDEWTKMFMADSEKLEIL